MNKISSSSSSSSITSCTFPNEMLYSDVSMLDKIGVTQLVLKKRKTNLSVTAFNLVTLILRFLKSPAGNNLVYLFIFVLLTFNAVLHCFTPTPCLRSGASLSPSTDEGRASVHRRSSPSCGCRVTSGLSHCERARWKGEFWGCEINLSSNFLKRAKTLICFRVKRERHRSVVAL